MYSKKYRTIGMLVVFLILCSNMCYAVDVPIWNQDTLLDSITVSSNIENTNSKEGNFLGLESGSAILIEQKTGKVLYEHNSHEQLRPASVTKVMSLLLIMEEIDKGKLNLTDNISCSENASNMGGSQIWLDTTETLTVEEMLKAICVVSANDCVMAMAEHIGGTEENFVNMMNEKANELGMNDTCFKNCHGIDEDGHVTSSYDIALMSKELLNNHPEITKYTTIWMDSLRNGESELVNTNKLVRNYEGCTGLKTGSTSLALYNLSASATRNDLSLIAVIMKGPTSQIRFNEAQKLLDYGFNNYVYKQFENKGETLKTINVSKGIEQKVEVVFENTAGVIIEKGKDKDIVQSINLDEVVQAPVLEGQKLGKMTFSLNGETVANIDLVAKSSVKKINIFSMTGKILDDWFYMLRKE